MSIFATLRPALLVPSILLPALLLASCQSEPLPVATVQPPLSNRGIDLPRDASDVLNELRGSGLGFVARYYRNPESRWPALTPSEAQRLSSLGLNIVAVWESHSHDPAYFSYASGYNDALSASRQARAVRQPAGSAIYFAVDYDAQPAALGSVIDYFRGVSAGLSAASGAMPLYKVGVYGSGAVCEAVKRAGLAHYSWLSNSTAWAGSLGYRGWNIRQTGRLSNLSFDHDADEARDDYGGFRLAAYRAAAPAASAPPPEAAAPRPQDGQWLTAIRSAFSL